MKKMSQGWCLESRKLMAWYIDRIELINKRVADPQMEKQSYERMLELVDELCPIAKQEA